MAKEIDEKTQKLIDNSAAKATKAAKKQVLDIVAEAIKDAGELEDKGAKKAVKEALAALKARIKDEVSAD